MARKYLKYIPFKEALNINSSFSSFLKYAMLLSLYISQHGNTITSCMSFQDGSSAVRTATPREMSIKKTNLYFSSNFYYGWNSMPSLREPDLNLDIAFFFFLVLNRNVLNFNLGSPFSHVISGLIFNCNVIISFPIPSKSGCKEISNEKKT